MMKNRSASPTKVLSEAVTLKTEDINIMANLSNEEIEQLQQQFKEKAEELKVTYNKLVDAGVVQLPDAILDSLGGGAVRPSTIGRRDNSTAFINR